MGDRERSRYYNHSTFNDLIITGLVGLRPRFDNKIEVKLSALTSIIID